MRQIFLSMAVTATLVGQTTTASAASEVTTQDVRNLIGEACLGSIALYDPAAFQRGRHNGQNDKICGCAVDAAIDAGFSEKQVRKEGSSNTLRLISGSHEAVKVVADRCGKELFGDEAPKLVKEK